MNFFPENPFYSYAIAYARYPFANLIAKHRTFPRVDNHTLIFTCDTELTPDWKVPRNCPTIEESLTSLYDLLGKFKVTGTFLVEGQFLEAYPDMVQELVKRHEIGYHGFAHESYGGFWSTSTKKQPRILEGDQIGTYLSEGKNLIYAVTGMDPKSFVAPFHLGTPRLIKELISSGWTADSSIYNHVYGLDRPFMIGKKLLEIPFSVSRQPNWRGYYSPILDSAEVNIEQAIKDCKTMEYIVITTHPWEMTQKRSRVLEELLGSLEFKSLPMNQVHVNNPAPQFN